ncbi:MAG: preprotein translocase subunit Sec61beta [Candidatus Methanomethylophilaceae archaeon]|jgi:preprotein translocase subunit Sec61beta
MAKKNQGGFQSSAGLMRYFDSETDKGYKISPRGVIGMAIALIVVVLVAQVFLPV